MEDKQAFSFTFKRQKFPAKHILIGITGSISAAMMVPSIVWLRQSLGIQDIRVIMTSQAARIVPPTTISVVTGSKTLVDWSDAEATDVPHITLAQWADIILVMPATANLLAKVAHGIADDLLSTCLLAAECPVIYAAAMNNAMWRKSATQRNIVQLRADGYHVIDPMVGYAVADGVKNDGAMVAITTVIEQAVELLNSRTTTALSGNNNGTVETSAHTTLS